MDSKRLERLQRNSNGLSTTTATQEERVTQRVSLEITGLNYLTVALNYVLFSPENPWYHKRTHRALAIKQL